MKKWILTLLPLLLLGCSKEAEKAEELKPLVGKYGYINGEEYNDIVIGTIYDVFDAREEYINRSEAWIGEDA